MACETAERLSRAVVLRHTSEAQGFWMAALEALIAGEAEPEAAADALAAALRPPLIAASVSDWLAGLAEALGLDPDRILARAGAVAVALAAIPTERRTGPPADRSRLREALDRPQKPAQRREA